VTSPALLRTRSARAANSNNRDAVTFNNTLLSNPGGIARMPAAASNFIVAFNYRATTLPTNSISRTVLVCNGGTITNTLSIRFASDGLGHALFALEMNGSSTYYRAYSPPMPFDGLWHPVVAAMDAAQGLCTSIVDGNPITMTPQSGSSQVSVDFTKVTYVGANGVSGHSVTNPCLGDIADLTLWAGAYVDPTDPAITSRFYDANGEVPVRMGPTGWWVLGYPGFFPQICLSGPASMFMKNMAAGGFDETGVPTYVDTVPTSMFTLTKGSLVTAASDPWTDPA
jgi:hypothetical protein